MSTVTVIPRTRERTSFVLQGLLIVVVAAWIVAGSQYTAAAASIALVLIGSLVAVVLADRDDVRQARLAVAAAEAAAHRLPLPPGTPIYVADEAIAMLAYGAHFPMPAELAG